MEWYRHKQTSTGLIVVFILVTTLTVVLAVSIPSTPARRITGAVLVIAMWLGALFSSLTTVVTDEDFIFHFGGGFWKKRVPLSDIRAVRTARASVWDGLGIHLTRRGWVYNVWGLDAVEIERANGSRLRVGTDEPGPLAEAIGERLKRISPPDAGR